MQMGHWKQLRVHLEKYYSWSARRLDVNRCINVFMSSFWGAVAPISITLDIAARHLKQAIGTVVRDNLLCYTPWTPDLVAVFAVEQVLERVQAIVCTGSSGIEGFLESVEFMCRGCGIAVAMAGEVCRVGAGALDVRVRSRSSHSGDRRGRRGRRGEIRFQPSLALRRDALCSPSRWRRGLTGRDKVEQTEGCWLMDPFLGAFNKLSRDQTEEWKLRVLYFACNAMGRTLGGIKRDPLGHSEVAQGPKVKTPV